MSYLSNKIILPTYYIFVGHDSVKYLCVCTCTSGLESPNAPSQITFYETKDSLDVRDFFSHSCLVSDRKAVLYTYFLIYV